MTYESRIICIADQTAPVCSNPLVCIDPPGSVLYGVYRSDDYGATFTRVSEVCLTNPPNEEPPVLTPGDVAKAFQAIAWPESPLQIQPPGGRTLVNLETNFLTDNVGPRTQTVPLLGQSVEIEATPTSWTWNHGDGTAQTTSTPGRAYPDLDVTHTYTAAETTVSPSVDTTYSGRYRVNGGPWIDIPATVTINGVAGALEILTASPQLVGTP